MFARHDGVGTPLVVGGRNITGSELGLYTVVFGGQNTPMLQRSTGEPLVALRHNQVEYDAGNPFRRGTGLPATPTWRTAFPVTAPPAGSAIITVAASPISMHRVFGVHVGKEDAAANFIQLRAGGVTQTGWSAHDAPKWAWTPLAILQSAVNTAVSLNVLNAGAANIDYVGALLVETSPV